MLPAIVFVLTCTTIFNLFPTPTQAKPNELNTYIVHLTSPQLQNPHQLEQWYHSFLTKVSSTSNHKPKMLFAYRHVITGFAAELTAEQATMMKNLSGVLFVRPQGVYQLHTTRTPYFLGLQESSGLWADSNKGKGVIIGILDSGVTPHHPSFDDKGVPPPPPRWKGRCELKVCNNKLIGLRNFYHGNYSPLDEEGHGTHTSSTAAGNYVDNANVYGEANGTATGIAPMAHLAMYTVCKFQRCDDSGILAGMDAAIEDGVDVLSLSLGAGLPIPYYNDTIAIGAFAAIQKGIFVSCSAGNSGPYNASLSNPAPWILTVGASTIDRRILASFSLGNKKTYEGESLYQPKDFDRTLKPLACESYDNYTKCTIGTAVYNESEASAMIYANNIVAGETILVRHFNICATDVGYKEGTEIRKYVNSTSSPVATILFGGTVLGINSAPCVAFFSSRGPNTISPGILKPDIIGPGVGILAAWYESIDEPTGSKPGFNIIHGTSMSCPHLAGTAALLKSAHPEWSPAAIKSAIMTTASQISRDGNPILDEREHPADVFAIGSGHVNPPRANNPGLIFDIQPEDYIAYLCGLRYTPKEIQIIVRKTVSCSKTIQEEQLNYPSIVVSVTRGDNKTYTRTVTNVGEAISTYTIRDVSVPHGVGVTVRTPSSDQRLSFTQLNQTLTYEVTFIWNTWSTVEEGTYGQGHMTWVFGNYTVRTPFSFKFE